MVPRMWLCVCNVVQCIVMYILSQCGTPYTMVESYQLVQDVSKWFTLYANESWGNCYTNWRASIQNNKEMNKWLGGLSTIAINHWHIFTYFFKSATHLDFMWNRRYFLHQHGLLLISIFFRIGLDSVPAPWKWIVRDVRWRQTALERGFVFVLGPIDDTTNSHCNGSGADSSGESWFIVEGWFFCYV